MSKLKSVQSAQVKNVPVTKENIARFVKKDIEALYSLAYELLSTPGIVEILAEKLYTKHLAEVENQSRQVEQEQLTESENAN